jgi:hypothetical protein
MEDLKQQAQSKAEHVRAYINEKLQAAGFPDAPVRVYFNYSVAIEDAKESARKHALWRKQDEARKAGVEIVKAVSKEFGIEGKATLRFNYGSGFSLTYNDLDEPGMRDLLTRITGKAK